MGSNEKDKSFEQWEEYQAKIDREYEQKMKIVSDEAMKKLKEFQEEHRKKIEQSRIMFETSWSITSKRSDSRGMRSPRQQPQRTLEPN